MNERPFSSNFRCDVVGVNIVARLRMLDEEFQSKS